MSTVYLAYDNRRDRTVALKVLATDLAARTEFVRRFHRESYLARKLSHPNLVDGLEAGYDPRTGTHYLALEYVAGPSVQHLLAVRECLPVSAVVRIGINVCRALGHLHAHGYVHRDVKPENVLLLPIGSAKLCDLGLAKRLDSTADLTTVPHGIGTPNYMPYEQSLNASFVDERSDVFSLGATLYHLATGRLPFSGETPEELARGKVADRVRPPSTVRDGLPEAFDRLVLKAMTFDPRTRYQRAGEFETALFASGLGEVDAGSDWVTTSGAVDEESTHPTRPDLAPIAAAVTPSGLAVGLVDHWTMPRKRRRPTDWVQAAALCLSVSSIGFMGTVGVRSAVRAVESAAEGNQQKDTRILTGKPSDRAE
jgi:serine/threonine-protein kinase